MPTSNTHKIFSIYECIPRYRSSTSLLLSDREPISDGDVMFSNQSLTRTPNDNQGSLSELALDAAIELEKAAKNEPTDLSSLSELAKSLENDFDDLSLFPIYERALASSAGQTLSTTTDVHRVLKEFSAQLSSRDPDQNEIQKLRDFCIALHGSLLTSRIDSLVSSFRHDER